jgi:hypothetical protein
MEVAVEECALGYGLFGGTPLQADELDAAIRRVPEDEVDVVVLGLGHVDGMEARLQ